MANPTSGNKILLERLTKKQYDFRRNAGLISPNTVYLVEEAEKTDGDMNSIRVGTNTMGHVWPDGDSEYFGSGNKDKFFMIGETITDDESGVSLKAVKRSRVNGRNYVLFTLCDEVYDLTDIINMFAMDRGIEKTSGETVGSAVDSSHELFGEDVIVPLQSIVESMEGSDSIMAHAVMNHPALYGISPIESNEYSKDYGLADRIYSVSRDDIGGGKVFQTNPYTYKYDLPVMDNLGASTEDTVGSLHSYLSDLCCASIYYSEFGDEVEVEDETSFCVTWEDQFDGYDTYGPEDGGDTAKTLLHFWVDETSFVDGSPVTEVDPRGWFSCPLEYDPRTVYSSSGPTQMINRSHFGNVDDSQGRCIGSATIPLNDGNVYDISVQFFEQNTGLDEFRYDKVRPDNFTDSVIISYCTIDLSVVSSSSGNQLQLSWTFNMSYSEVLSSGYRLHLEVSPYNVGQLEYGLSQYQRNIFWNISTDKFAVVTDGSNFNLKYGDHDGRDYMGGTIMLTTGYSKLIVGDSGISDFELHEMMDSWYLSRSPVFTNIISSFVTDNPDTYVNLDIDNMTTLSNSYPTTSGSSNDLVDLALDFSVKATNMLSGTTIQGSFSRRYENPPLFEAIIPDESTLIRQITLSGWSSTYMYSLFDYTANLWHLVYGLRDKEAYNRVTYRLPVDTSSDMLELGFNAMSISENYRVEDSDVFDFKRLTETKIRSVPYTAETSNSRFHLLNPTDNEKTGSIFDDETIEFLPRYHEVFIAFMSSRSQHDFFFPMIPVDKGIMLDGTRYASNGVQ